VSHEDFYMLRFLSYAGHGTVEAFFRDKKIAERWHRRALNTRDEGAKFLRQNPTWTPFIPFDVVDDFGLRVSVNLFNHAIVFSTSDAAARRQEATTQASEEAEARHAGSRLGFMGREKKSE
jgi:hypothetical protein